MHARLAPEDVDRRIEDIVTEFRRRGLPLEWNVGASTIPGDLGLRLEAQGFEHVIRIPGMAIELRPLQETGRRTVGLTIEPVKTRGDLETYVRVGASAFDIPEVHVPRIVEIEANMADEDRQLTTQYVGRLEGKAVASCMLFLAAGVAGIYFVGTSPEARGRGIAEAMTRRALQDGRDLGYSIGILQASAMGHPIYRTMGFREYFHIDVYQSPRKPESRTGTER